MEPTPKSHTILSKLEPYPQPPLRARLARRYPAYMASVLYLVLRSREKWWVDMEGRSLGPFETSDIATFAAIDAARMRGDVNSHERQVFVEQPGRKFTMIWSSTHPPDMQDQARRA